MSRRFLVIIALLVSLAFLSLACQVNLNLTPTPEAATAMPLIQPTVGLVTEPPTEAPTEAETEEPTELETEEATLETELATLETEAPTEAATETTDPCPLIFDEQFNGTVPDCWTIYTVTGGTNAETTSIKFTNGALQFKYDAEKGNSREETYKYVFYDHYDYGNALFETSVANFGVNKNGIAMVCGVDKTGWWESRISSGGELKMYRYDAATKTAGGNPYTELASGGISTIRVGEGRANVLQLSCMNGSMTLNVNGKDIKTVTMKGYAGGGLGVGAMAFSNTAPVIVEFDYITIK